MSKKLVINGDDLSAHERQVLQSNVEGCGFDVLVLNEPEPDPMDGVFDHYEEVEANVSNALDLTESAIVGFAPYFVHTLRQKGLTKDDMNEFVVMMKEVIDDE